MKITYEQAVEAKKILISYLTETLDFYVEPQDERNKSAKLVLYSLLQDYFLD